MAASAACLRLLSQRYPKVPRAPALGSPPWFCKVSFQCPRDTIVRRKVYRGQDSRGHDTVIIDYSQHSVLVQLDTKQSGCCDVNWHSSKRSRVVSPARSHCSSVGSVASDRDGADGQLEVPSFVLDECVMCTPLMSIATGRALC